MLIIAALLLVRRPWAAEYFLVATLVTGSTVQLLKHVFGRARPEDIHELALPHPATPTHLSE